MMALALNSGNVGIGTTSPIGGGLDILGDEEALVVRTGDSGRVGIAIKNTTTGSDVNFTDGFIFKLDSDESAHIVQSHSNYLAFSTNATERMRILSGGNVCIGGTTDEGYNTLLNLEGAGGTDDVPGILFKNTSASNDEDIMALIASQGADSVGAINI